jgi:hypothetical protein
VSFQAQIDLWIKAQICLRENLLQIPQNKFSQNARKKLILFEKLQWISKQPEDLPNHFPTMMSNLRLPMLEFQVLPR